MYPGWVPTQARILSELDDTAECSYVLVGTNWTFV